jgi:hypothetical protein
MGQETEVAPREGLPPCQRKAAVFEDRAAGFWEYPLCDSCKHRSTFRFGVGAVLAETWEESQYHPPHRSPWGIYAPIQLVTDDKAEAEAAWEKAERWVRTGELE